MAIVIDASIAATWCFRDRPGTAEADEVMARVHNEPAIVPDLFWHEIRNVLVVAERKGRIEPNAADTHLNRLRNLPLITDRNQNDAETLALARQHNLSGYDAAYLETAHRRQAHLATLDKTLSQATTRTTYS